jgi:hypothetical protein
MKTEKPILVRYDVDLDSPLFIDPAQLSFNLTLCNPESSPTFPARHRRRLQHAPVLGSLIVTVMGSGLRSDKV